MYLAIKIGHFAIQNVPLFLDAVPFCPSLYLCLVIAAFSSFPYLAVPKYLHKKGPKNPIENNENKESQAWLCSQTDSSEVGEIFKELDQDNFTSYGSVKSRCSKVHRDLFILTLNPVTWEDFPKRRNDSPVKRGVSERRRSGAKLPSFCGLLLSHPSQLC